MRWLEIAKTEVLEHRRQPWMLFVLTGNYVVLCALLGAYVWYFETHPAHVRAMESAGIELDASIRVAVQTFGSLVFANLSTLVATSAGYAVLHDRMCGTLPFLMLAPVSRRTLLVGKVLGAMSIPCALHVVFVGLSVTLLGQFELLAPHRDRFGGSTAWWVAFLLGAPASALFVSTLGAVISSLAKDTRTSMQWTAWSIGVLGIVIGLVLVDAIGEGVELQLAFAAGCLVLSALTLEIGARIISRDLGAS